MFALDGRVVLVTGGNGGIGLGMAEACAKAGADIAIWGTNAEKNAAAEVRLKETGRQVVALQCDIGDEQQVIDSFAATVERLGKVDALFANSGIGGLANFTDMSLDEWRRIMRVNLDGTFLTSARRPATWSPGARAARSSPCRRCRPSTARRAWCTTAPARARSPH